MRETPLMKSIQIACSTGTVRLFRNNVGEAWAGKSYRDNRGAIVIPEPYRITYGLCPGSADLVGFRSIKITADMVGQHVAVFASVEVKLPRSHMTYNQEAWAEMISAHGGRAGVARSIADAKKILDGKN